MPLACAAPSASSTSDASCATPPSGSGAALRRVIDDRRERRAVEILHDDVRPAVGQHREIEHVDDALVADQVDRLRLGEEPLDEIAAIAALARQHLDRDAAADRRMHALVDAAHAADAEQPRDAIRADRRAEQHVVADRREQRPVGRHMARAPAATRRTRHTRTSLETNTARVRMPRARRTAVRPTCRTDRHRNRVDATFAQTRRSPCCYARA